MCMAGLSTAWETEGQDNRGAAEGKAGGESQETQALQCSHIKSFPKGWIPARIFFLFCLFVILAIFAIILLLVY